MKFMISLSIFLKHHQHAAVHIPCGGAYIYRWWRGGGVVGIGVGGGSRRSSEEEAGGIGRRQHHALASACLVTGGV